MSSYEEMLGAPATQMSFSTRMSPNLGQEQALIDPNIPMMEFVKKYYSPSFKKAVFNMFNKSNNRSNDEGSKISDHSAKAKGKTSQVFFPAPTQAEQDKETTQDASHGSQGHA